MKEVLDRHPEVVGYACEAVRRAGLEVQRPGRFAAAPTARGSRSWACRRRTSSPASTTFTRGSSGCRCRTWRRRSRSSSTCAGSGRSGPEARGPGCAPDPASPDGHTIRSVPRRACPLLVARWPGLLGVVLTIPFLLPQMPTRPPSSRLTTMRSSLATLVQSRGRSAARTWSWFSVSTPRARWRHDGCSIPRPIAPGTSRRSRTPRSRQADSRCCSRAPRGSASRTSRHRKPATASYSPSPSCTTRGTCAWCARTRRIRDRR